MRRLFHLPIPGRLFAVAAVAALMTASPPFGTASAFKFKTLYSFCAKTNCADGIGPEAALVMDSAGNLYGTTDYGGAHGDANTGGTAFELQFTGTGYKYKLLHTFCSKSNCADGQYPSGSLILDTKGRLYSTTAGGGAYSGGNVFRLVPSSDGLTWAFQTLYDFCSQAGCPDGSSSNAALTYRGAESGALYDGTSALFGTAFAGGLANKGVVFRLSFVTGQIRRNESVIYSFCAQPGCVDGAGPDAPLLAAGGGLFFGTTIRGGGADDGTVFRLSPQPGGFSEDVLYSFCSVANCTDGQYPESAVVMNANGNLFGTTRFAAGNESGVVFKLTTGASPQETVLHSFCADYPTCSDGEDPWSLAMDANGNLLGTTAYGGQFHSGTVFKLHGTGFSVLHNFCSDYPTCSKGSNPWTAGLIVDAAGNLFGTTETGGANGQGMAFELVR